MALAAAFSADEHQLILLSQNSLLVITGRDGNIHSMGLEPYAITDENNPRVNIRSNLTLLSFLQQTIK